MVRFDGSETSSSIGLALGLRSLDRRLVALLCLSGDSDGECAREFGWELMGGMDGE